VRSSRKVGNQRLIEDIGIVWGFLETIVKKKACNKRLWIVKFNYMKEVSDIAPNVIRK
jgi:hypothetical protein